MESAMDWGLDRENFLSFSRVKRKLGALFLSSLVTADGKHLETFACQRESSTKLKSRYKFPREEPTDYDWQV